MKNEKHLGACSENYRRVHTRVVHINSRATSSLIMVFKSEIFTSVYIVEFTFTLLGWRQMLCCTVHTDSTSTRGYQL